jgi:microcystin-dependent protein
MAEPFLAEIRIVSFAFAPKGWAQTNGQLLPINQNQALFSLLGTMYGGNGQTTFALPDIRSRIPMHQGTSAQLSTRTLGQKGGAEVTAFPTAQIPGAPVTPITALAVPSSPVFSLSPFLVLNFVIALQGIFPSQN